MAAQQPGEPVVATLLASNLIWTGWRIRSGLCAQHVAREQFEQFHDYPQRAERILIDTTIGRIEQTDLEHTLRVIQADVEHEPDLRR